MTRRSSRLVLNASERKDPLYLGEVPAPESCGLSGDPRPEPGDPIGFRFGAVRLLSSKILWPLPPRDGLIRVRPSRQKMNWFPPSLYFPLNQMSLQPRRCLLLRPLHLPRRRRSLSKSGQ